MSNIALVSPATGTATFSITTPSGTSTDRTLDLPDAAGTIQVSGNPISGTTGSFSGDLSFNSGYGSAAVAYGCRAWVNFDGTGTVAIRASGNVSSITDNGTGLYTVNFTTAMPDANYCVQTTADDVDCGTGYTNSQATPPTTTSVAVHQFLSDTNTYRDALQFSVAIFR
jgi:hypothetical protein